MTAQTMKGGVPMRIEASTATVASAAATSPAWLPDAERAVSMLGHPIWGELLAPLGVLWLIVQIGFFLYEKMKRREAAKKGEVE